MKISRLNYCSRLNHLWKERFLSRGTFLEASHPLQGGLEQVPSGSCSSYLLFTTCFSSTWKSRFPEKNLTDSIWDKTEKVRYLHLFSVFSRGVQNETSPLCTLLGILHYFTWLLLSYYISLTQTHTYALPQLCTSISESCLCFLESERFGSAHTDYPYTTCTISHFCIIFTVPGAGTLPAYSFHMWKQYLSQKTFSSAPYWKELSSLKNSFKTKINLAVKPWWQWTNELEIKY